MDLLLNTIMLEPNRWTPDHILSQPLVDLLDPIDEAGFKELELWGFHVDTIDDGAVAALAEGIAARSMRALGVGAYPSFHLSGSEDAAQIAQLERVVSVSATLGAELFKIFPGRVASSKADEAIWARTIERLRALADRLGEEGMTLTFETHGGTLCDDLAGTLRLLESLAGYDNVGICFQPYTEHDTDEAIATFDALSDRVLHLHVQNRGDDRVMTLLEEGDWTDYRRFLPHVQAAGFDGSLCIEFTRAIVPAAGEAFNLSQVLANARLDRRFIEGLWAPAAG